jgi:hypothetical protein
MQPAFVHALSGREHPVTVSDDGRDYLCTACGAELPECVIVHTAANPQTGKCVGTRAETSDGVIVHDCAKTKIPGGKGTDAERVALRGGKVPRPTLPENFLLDAVGDHTVAHEAFVAATCKKHGVDSVATFLALTQV